MKRKAFLSNDCLGWIQRVICTTLIVLVLVPLASASPEMRDLSQAPLDAVRLLSIGRTIERILVVLIGGLSLYLGFRLFDKSLASDSSLDAGGEKYYVRLKKIGPGVLFALFGTIVSLYSLFSKPEFSTMQSPNTVSVSMKGALPESSSAAGTNDLLVRSMTTVERLSVSTKALSDEERLALREAARNLESIKATLVDQIFGHKGTYDDWSRKQALFLGDPETFNKLSDDEKEHFREVDDLVSRTLLR